MTRLVPFAAIALLALPAFASAQPAPTVIVGPPVVGGRVVIGPPISNGASALFPVEVAVPPRFSVGGGSLSPPPQVWVPSGAWSVLNYAWPEAEVVVVPPSQPAPVRVNPRRNGDAPQTVAVQPVVSGEVTATLVVQFPAAAELWVGGQKRNGSVAEWTLTSPTLKPGVAHTFEVRGRWQSGGKTFESSRSVTVNAGDRNRVIVVSGTEAR